MAVSNVSYRRTFWRLIGFLRPYRTSMGVSVLLAAGSQAAAIVAIFVTKDVVAAVQRGDHHTVWLLVGTIVAVGLARALMMLGRRLISGNQALAVEMDMRRDVYAKL